MRNQQHQHAQIDEDGVGATGAHVAGTVEGLALFRNRLEGRFKFLLHVGYHLGRVVKVVRERLLELGSRCQALLVTHIGPVCSWCRVFSSACPLVPEAPPPAL